MILGTAGHIDHGKTTLVRALTGVNTDRLPEEKRRGITIDLGFAPLVLEGVGTVGVVDVPGHEAFVRTMLAGATGIDLALLVVAADEGVMPQTREHLAILTLLAVRGGVVAITKADLVDADWLALVQEDVRDALAGTSLAAASLIPVSASTGAGLDDLRAALVTAARAVPARSIDEEFRLPIDRAFTVRGTGTVVTGTVWSGRLTRDGLARLLPADTTVRVRGLHAHGRAVDATHAGDRVAIALAGVGLDSVGRGCTLVQGDAWHATRVLRADVALLDDAPRALGPRSRVRLHLGTSEVGARIVVADGPLAPGMRASARVVLDEAVVARAGDRFVLRAASPVATLGGGVVLDPHAPLRARPWPAAGRSPADRLALLVSEAGAAGVQVGDLSVRLGLAAADVAAVTDGLGGWRVGERLLASPVRAALAQDALDALDAFHSAQPLEAGAPLQWLRSRLRAPEPVAVALLAEMSAAGLVATGQGLVRRPGFTARLSPELRAMRTTLLAHLAAAGAEPASIDELARSLPAAPAELTALARLLVREGLLVQVEADRFYDADAVARLLQRLRDGMSDAASYGPSEFREMLGVSRKFLIPFLEHCDREGYTIRDAAGKRRIAP